MRFINKTAVMFNLGNANDLRMDDYKYVKINDVSRDYEIQHKPIYFNKAEFANALLS